MQKTQAIIVGGGIGGLAVALAFEKNNLDYVVLEQAEQISAVGGGLQIWSNGIHCLKKLGLKYKLKEKAHTIEQIELQTDKSKSLFVLDFSSQLSKHPWLETITIHRADLINILLHPLPKERIFLNSKVKSFEEDSKGVAVTLTSEKKIRGDFLIGADGIHSTIRKGLDNRKLRYAGYTCWRGLMPIDGSVPSYKPKLCQAISAGSIFGFVPLKDHVLQWWATLVDKPDPSKKLKLEQLEQTFSNYSESIKKIIQKTPPDSIVRHDIYDLKPKKTWGRGLCTLVGDSTHAATPHLAQGAGMALESALVLADSLISHFQQSKKHRESQALRIYEKRRYHRTTAVIKESKWIGRYLHCRHPLLIKTRNLVCSGLPARWIIKWKFKKHISWQAIFPPDKQNKSRG